MTNFSVDDSTLYAKTLYMYDDFMSIVTCHKCYKLPRGISPRT